MAAPKKAGIKKLKAKLSEYVKRAAKGEKTLITDRGEVVAELVPHRPEPALTVVDRLLEMARQGRIRLAPGFPDHMRPISKWEPLTEKIPEAKWRQWREEDRADKR